jgi:glycosyltransferase involved in cell wall biosynthesis
MVDRIRRQIAADGLSDRVFFVESTTTIERYFQAANIYVLPSIREGLPLALLEAMASGLACVATRLPGSTDSVIDDGRNGLLVEPDDERAFASAIRALILDLERAARLGSSARETVVERYSIQKTAPAWLAVYRELASCA